MGEENSMARRPFMGPRNPEEAHRSATPLELFFDLVFVVAIAQAASGLHHAIVEDHVFDGLLGFAMVFFAIWWAWMSFTWFASAYDADDVPYRLTVFVQITGALVLAAGVPAAFSELDFLLLTVGYVIMRVATVTQWIRAGRGDPDRRVTARRYAVGVVILQVCWVALLAAPDSTKVVLFFGLVLAELAVPLWAEAAAGTPWHAEHIAERYGLLTIIVLGESVLAATIAIESAMADGSSLGLLLPTIAGGLLTLYSMWWFYFDRPVHGVISTLPRAFIWGYGHYLIFASGAALGVGIAVFTDQVTGHSEITSTVAGAALAFPSALFLLVIWGLHHRVHADEPVARWSVPLAIPFILATPFLPHAPLALGAILCTLLGVRLFARRLQAEKALP